MFAHLTDLGGNTLSVLAERVVLICKHEKADGILVTAVCDEHGAALVFVEESVPEAESAVLRARGYV